VALADVGLNAVAVDAAVHVAYWLARQPVGREGIVGGTLAPAVGMATAGRGMINIGWESKCVNGIRKGKVREAGREWGRRDMRNTTLAIEVKGTAAGLRYL